MRNIFMSLAAVLLLIAMPGRILKVEVFTGRSNPYFLICVCLPATFIDSANHSRQASQ
jgi:hypothetical protein